LELEKPHFQKAMSLRRSERRLRATTERALTALFRAFPHNTQMAEVLVKVAALNELYATNIYAVHDVAKHIYEQGIDVELPRHSLEVVGKIALITIGKRQRRNYSFATKYCSFHAPEVYPLYDWYVDAMLWAYRRQDEFAQFQHKALWECYPGYVEILKQFRSYYGLVGLSWREIDKFLWLYGKDMESKKNNNMVDSSKGQQ
jgi:hypothetical protein